MKVFYNEYIINIAHDRGLYEYGKVHRRSERHGQGRTEAPAPAVGPEAQYVHVRALQESFQGEGGTPGTQSRVHGREESGAEMAQRLQDTYRISKLEYLP